MSADNVALNNIQTWLQYALINPGLTSRQTIEQYVKPSSRLKADQLFGIYQRSYYLRLLHCMREQFPALCHALGRNLFTDFAHEYLQAYPSESYTLYDLGCRFPDYLEQTRPDKDLPQRERESWIDFMVDLCRFERQLFVLFDAPGYEGIQLLADDATPDHLLYLQPCFALGEYRFPVANYYHQVRIGHNPAIPVKKHSQVALVRKNYLTQTLVLTHTQHSFLVLLHQGYGIDDALENIASQIALPLDQVRQSWKTDGIRKRWIDAGMFVVKKG